MGGEFSGTAADGGDVAEGVSVRPAPGGGLHGNPAGPRPCAWHHEAASDSFPAAETGLIQWAAELAFPQASGLKLLPGPATGWLCTIFIHFASWSSGSLHSLDPLCALFKGSSWSLNVYSAPAT